MSLFEYALLRVVPRVERGEFINAGVVLYCQDARYLDARVHLNTERLRALDPDLDPETYGHTWRARAVCEAARAGPWLFPQVQRCGWYRPAAPWCTLLGPGFARPRGSHTAPPESHGPHAGIRGPVASFEQEAELLTGRRGQRADQCAFGKG